MKDEVVQPTQAYHSQKGFDGARRRPDSKKSPGAGLAVLMSSEYGAANRVLTASSPASNGAPWARRPDQLYWYDIYGIRLSSEIQLSFPESEPTQSADVSVIAASPEFFQEATRLAVVEPNPTRWYKYAQLDNGQSYLRWDDLFEFLIDADGSRIWCGWLGAASLESLQVYLLGHALSFALVKQGYEPLHATAIVIDGQAIAFLGSSGFGKSSLAAAFLADGGRLLTDDMLVLSRRERGYEAQPGPRRIKLFPKMARRFLTGTGSAVPMNNETEKLVLPLSADQRHHGSPPLGALYLLAPPRTMRRKQSIELTSLTTREAFIALVRGTFNPLISDADRLRRQYNECLTIASRVPARRISYPRVLAILPAVKQAILDDFFATTRERVRYNITQSAEEPLLRSLA